MRSSHVYRRTASSLFLFALSFLAASGPHHCVVHAQQLQAAPKASEVLESPIFTRCDDKKRQEKCLQKVAKREQSMMKMDSSDESDDIAKKLRDTIGLIPSCWSCIRNRIVKAQICSAVDYGANLLYTTYKVPVPIPSECVQEFVPSPAPSEISSALGAPAIAVDGDGSTSGEVNANFFFPPLLPPLLLVPVFAPVVKPVIPKVDCPGGSEGHICSETFCTCDKGLRCVEIDNLSCGGAFLKLNPTYSVLKDLDVAPGVCRQGRVDASSSKALKKLIAQKDEYQGIINKARDFADNKLNGGAPVKDMSTAKDIQKDPKYNNLKGFFDDFKVEEVDDLTPDDGVTFYFGASAEGGIGVKAGVSEGIFFDTKGTFGIFVCGCAGAGYNIGGGADGFLGIQMGVDSMAGFSTSLDFDVDFYAGGGLAMGQTCDNKGVLNVEISVGVGAGINLGSLSVCKCETIVA